MTTIAIIQARMGSSRLPGKSLANLAGRPVLAWVVEAATAIRGIDRTVVATTDSKADDKIVAWCDANSVICHRGSENDVLDRYAKVAEAEDADTIVRLTGDCPLLDPEVCGQVHLQFLRTGADYASNCNPPTWPDGLDCEVFTRRVLDDAAAHAVLPIEREHVTPYIRNRRHEFRIESVICPISGLHRMRWTLDTPADLKFLRLVVDRLVAKRPPAFTEILEIIEHEPEICEVNAGQRRNEGSVERPVDAVVSAKRDYRTSWTMLERAEQRIPLGSQTFSKSRIQYPENAAPLFVTHGNGGRIWDVDGNVYVDLVCGLFSVGLGYHDPDVDQAVRDQLNHGISFSLATELESDLAELLVDLIPCAEKVRFGKNGTDATSATVRIARAATGRDRIAVCGYHGWQDWYIGSTTRHKGVPDAVRALTQSVAYGDIDAVDMLMGDHPGEFAALILEPAGIMLPPPGYLEELICVVHGHGALLIFDEMITGFRWSLGGAQGYYGVTPDLASFGKAMGNGMPISAVVGRADLMDQMEEVFYSGTFGGETLSIAAAIAVIKKMQVQPVIEGLWQAGEQLARGLRDLIIKSKLNDIIEVVGLAPWSVVSIRDHPAARRDAIRTFLLKEMLSRGVLTLGTHNVCYAHDEADIGLVLAAYGKVLPFLAEELATGTLETNLGCAVIEPIFRVR